MKVEEEEVEARLVFIFPDRDRLLVRRSAFFGSASWDRNEHASVDRTQRKGHDEAVQFDFVTSLRYQT